MSIIGIPLAILLTLMPGIWIYLTPALVAYYTLRLFFDRASPALLLAVAAILSLTAGFVIPSWANKITDERVEALLAQDHGSPPTLPSGLSYTHAMDRGLGSADMCWDTCQRLLFSRTAKSFTDVSLDMLSAPTSQPITARRFSIGPIGAGCNNARLKPTYATSAELGRAITPPAPLLWDKLDDLAKEGLCLHDEPVRDLRSDVLVIEHWNYDPAFWSFGFDGRGWRLSLHPIAPFKRREVFRRTPSGLTRLMRRTEVQFSYLAEPLWLVPGFSFDTTTPTHWAWRDLHVAGSPMEIYEPEKWNGILANDLTVHGLR